jgi:hypothetical protein
MECDAPGKPKTVLLGFGVGVEVRGREENELVGYLDANCKGAWVSKNDETKFSFRTV